MRDGLAVIALLRRSIGKRTPHPTSLRPAPSPKGEGSNQPFQNSYPNFVKRYKSVIFG